MGSFDRKLRRNQAKAGHRVLKQQWKRENIRRSLGVEVPVTSGVTSPTLSNEATKDPETTTVPFVPTVETRRLPLLGRPPTLGQYQGMVKKMQAEAQEKTERMLAEHEANAAKAREEADRKVDREWKDE